MRVILYVDMHYFMYTSALLFLHAFYIALYRYQFALTYTSSCQGVVRRVDFSGKQGGDAVLCIS